MSILNKTIFTGLAVATLSAGSMSVMTTDADAGYRYGHRHHGYHYNYYAPKCFYKYVWRTDYYGNSYRKRIRICN